MDILSVKSIGIRTAFSMATFLVTLLALVAGPVSPAAAGSMAVSHELDVELGYAGGARTLQDDQGVGSVNEFNTDAKYVISPEVTKDLLLRFGAEWARFTFDTPQAGALPHALQQFTAVMGFDYQLSDQWLIRGEIQPGIYGDTRQTGWRSFDAPLFLGGVYLQDADLQWFFGLRIDVKSEIPVFPALGVRWKFADVWTLNFQLPNPRMEYDVSDKIKAYVGTGIKAGTYVVGDNFGIDHGIPQLNHATVDYTAIRSGPGFSWEIRPKLMLEVDGGYMFFRRWDFFEQHVHLDSRPAPYLQLACHARF